MANLPWRGACAILVCVLSGLCFAADELRLASPFSDNMVLQRGRPIRVWGDAGANGTVEVTLGTAAQTTQADGHGHWTASLPARDATTEPLVLRASSAGKQISVANVLVGDVWLCSGQSNMAMTLSETDGGPELGRQAATLRHLRLLTIPKRPAPTPQQAFDARWQSCSPQSAGGFAAVGFYFGVELLRDPALENVPIGLIDDSVGGTAAEAWTSKEALHDFKPDELLVSLFGIAPSHLYNAMVAPLAPYAISGVLWYQGESNDSKPELYPRILSTMIGDWRRAWNDPSMPFLIVQLPAFIDPHFVWIRGAQAEVVKTTPHTALAVTIDTADGYNLHPKEKREVGRRLSLLARQMVYQEKLIAQGPQFKSAAVDGNIVRVSFDTAGDGLVARGSSEAGVRGFALAGDDGAYRFAQATIQGDDVVVQCDAVPQPKTVRYAWSAIPEANLANRSGLPAAPFRTDSLGPSMIEVLKQTASQKVSTPAYEIEISGDGKVTSLGVHGKQFISNGIGASGGTSLPGFLGPRSLADVRALGPDCLSCSDNEVTLLFTFRDTAMDWAIINHGKSALPFRIALNAHVNVAKDREGQVLLSRGATVLSIAPVDAIADGEEGKALEVKVDGGQTRHIHLDAAPANR